MSETITVPLYARDGSERAWALLSPVDGLLAAHRWWLTAGGYAMRRLPGHGQSTYVYMHREVMGATDPQWQVDHINRNRLDNRRENLRLVPASMQAQNTGSTPGSSSRYRGVSWDRARHKWKAGVMVDRVFHNLGRFETEEEAAAVASAFRAKHVPYSEDARDVVLFPERKGRAA